VGVVPPTELADGRISLHWAAQIVASIGFSFVPAEDDFGHTALTWDASTRALCSRVAPAGFRAALAVADAELLLTDRDGAQSDRFVLAGRSIEDAYAFMAAAVAKFIGHPIGGRLVRPGHDMPDHEIGRGYGAFEQLSTDVREELARWFGNAYALLDVVRERESGGEVLCWPHHFDIATLVALDPPDAASARSIGVGMTPGDGSYDEPYLYVTPWPYPDASGLGALDGGGTWHTEGWTGAVLPATKLVDATDAASQIAQVTAFVDSAIAACRAAL
jgi:hypothetical protein